MIDIITLNECKVHLTIKETDQTNDILLQQLIRQVSALIRIKTRKEFITYTDLVEYITPLELSQYISVKQTPITKITYLKEDGSALVENTDFFASYSSGMIKRAGSSLWTEADRGVEIKYDSGEDIPEGLKMVAADWVGIISGLKKKTYITGEGIETAVTLTTLPDWISSGLKNYTRPLI